MDESTQLIRSQSLRCEEMFVSRCVGILGRSPSPWEPLGIFTLCILPFCHFVGHELGAAHCAPERFSVFSCRSTSLIITGLSAVFGSNISKPKVDSQLENFSFLHEKTCAPKNWGRLLVCSGMTPVEEVGSHLPRSDMKSLEWFQREALKKCRFHPISIQMSS